MAARLSYLHFGIYLHNITDSKRDKRFICIKDGATLFHLKIWDRDSFQHVRHRQKFLFYYWTLETAILIWAIFLRVDALSYHHYSPKNVWSAFLHRISLLSAFYLLSCTHHSSPINTGDSTVSRGLRQGHSFGLSVFGTSFERNLFFYCSVPLRNTILSL
ncbi:hypothetical protein GQ43DRAFT_98467 [Delitschia confertaspora ATCC 74209]|uniref:Uncharacterized protein n=1 Tax=Delitschia confertaspora ATCC 74209 TaxID=1513339 RepID=A0A9P4JI76_9PLEO|nr:hypothetical protein GQ43DRAFT_98467 [Delitschia confertaspora ATCC 74209]